MAKPRRADRPFSPLKALAVGLLVVALVAGGWAAWAYVGTDLVAQRAHDDALDTLQQRWADAADTDAEAEAELPPPVAGEPAWVLEIPAIGVRAPIIAGTEPADLRRGVGWYPTTNLPGQAGNVAVAGHRIGHGEPFRRLLDLEAGDEVVVETQIKRYTYALRVAPGELTVQADDSWVLDPVPGKDFEPHEAVLTLTAQQDLHPTSDRSVGFAVLVKEEPK